MRNELLGFKKKRFLAALLFSCVLGATWHLGLLPSNVQASTRFYIHDYYSHNSGVQYDNIPNSFNQSKLEKEPVSKLEKQIGPGLEAYNQKVAEAEKLKSEVDRLKEETGALKKEVNVLKSEADVLKSRTEAPKRDLPNQAVENDGTFKTRNGKDIIKWKYNDDADPKANAHKNHWIGFKNVNINCSKAFLPGAKNEEFNATVRRTFPYQYTSLCSNCSHMRAALGFSRYPRPSQEELDFPLAFSIVFHKDMDQVVFLLRAIYRPHNTYCLHPDAKVTVEFLEAVQAIASCLPGVFVASKLENVVYAGYSRLQADINCMNDLVTSQVKWRYFMNLPGQEFPLRTNLEMVRILTLYNGSNDIEGIVNPRRMWKDRYLRKWAEVRDPNTGEYMNKGLRVPNVRAPRNFTVVKGSAYGTFSRGFVDYIVHDEAAIALLQWCRSVMSPDEYFWATLHHSGRAPGGYTGHPEGKAWLSAYALWNGDVVKCSTTYVRDICIFSVGDLHHLSKRPEFFANKLYISAPAALHCLDTWLWARTVTGATRDMADYEGLPFVRGQQPIILQLK